jgi:FixJ family two-component response regulator
MEPQGESMPPLVAVVDDDFSVRESLESLIRSVGLEVRLCASAEEFLSAPHPRKPDCLILDVRLTGMSGIELHRHLVAGKCRVPVIFITAHGSDTRASSEAASDWTVAYLTKPFSEDELLGAINTALKWGPTAGNQTGEPGDSHE